ncbi:hypothetical protein Ddye_029839 [Dipteronia dyeriana]|uniref:Uncharacterized protein n=1 Tax=Dipteronia dyeriana TaxID=168575 RepID=A0AAD9TFA9_9ROSI|nr:hypothetical protein Ddye_029839 [Dipteronia dyeriana]
MDCFTFSMYINGWAKTHKVGVNDVDIPDSECADTLFPARELSWNKLPEITKSETVTKRFLFEAETISKLKDEAMSGCGFTYSQPSTVEVMTALIWRAQHNLSKIRAPKEFCDIDANEFERLNIRKNTRELLRKLFHND